MDATTYKHNTQQTKYALFQTIDDHHDHEQLDDHHDHEQLRCSVNYQITVALC